MSISFLGKEGTEDSYKRISVVSRRPRAASDLSSIERANHLKPSRPPTPPPRRSSWAFSQRDSHQRHTSPPTSTKPRLRRKLKWPSLRSQITPSSDQDPQVLKPKPLDKIIMSSLAGPPATTGGTDLTAPDRDRDHGHNAATVKYSLPMPGLSGNANGPVGNLLKGPVDDTGKLKDAALLVGIKLDLEAEVHATARVRGDIVVGLY
ncbi:hypothetical protein F5Y06DRAFT_305084 [Hypoxylon sp. FL0890]|nr:hypothetical protein F5Y06DRAFT_305084 [Hypoxylon sp. FL0890]